MNTLLKLELEDLGEEVQEELLQMWTLPSFMKLWGYVLVDDGVPFCFEKQGEV